MSPYIIERSIKTDAIAPAVNDYCSYFSYLRILYELNLN